MNTCYNEHPPATAPKQLSHREDLCLRGALAGLKPADRGILQRIALALLSYADAAGRLSIGLSAAKMRAQRPRLALLETFDRIGEDSSPGSFS